LIQGLSKSRIEERKSRISKPAQRCPAKSRWGDHVRRVSVFIPTQGVFIMRVLSLYGVFVSMFLVSAGCQPNGGGQPNAKVEKGTDNQKAKLRAMYSTVAKLIADEQRADPAAMPPRRSSSRLIADARSLIAEMRLARDADPDLQMICDEATAATNEMINATQQLERLPRPPGEFDQFLTGFFYGCSFNFSGAMDYSRTIDNQQEAIRVEVVRLGQAMERAHAATLLLPRVARKIAGEPVAACPLTVDFDETWGFSGPDWITLTNRSGQTLHNVTVVVDLEGKPASGLERHTNVHFVTEWKNGASIYALYAEGVYIQGRKLGCKTVVRAQKVDIAVFADELIHTGFTYHYNDIEKNKDVARYVDKNFKPRASYRTFDAGFGILDPDHRAIRIDFTGSSMHHVNDVSAKVTFKNGTRSSTKTDFRSRWTFDQTWLIEFRDISWDPTEMRVELTFNAKTGGGVTRSYVWNR
jgi:hypothetical protein